MRCSPKKWVDIIFKIYQGTDAPHYQMANQIAAAIHSMPLAKQCEAQGGELPDAPVRRRAEFACAVRKLSKNNLHGRLPVLR